MGLFLRFIYSERGSHARKKTAFKKAKSESDSFFYGAQASYVMLQLVRLDCVDACFCLIER